MKSLDQWFGGGQSSIFESLPHARATDVDTSHDAIPENLTAQALFVLKAYANGDAMIDLDAYQRAGFHRPGWQRCSDLRKFGYIERTGEKGITPSGKSAHRCRITPKGLNFLKLATAMLNK